MSSNYRSKNMDKTSLLFKSVESQELPKNLKSTVFLAIKQERRKQAIKHLIVSSVALVLSLGATIWAFIYTVSAFAQTGFSEYFSLLLSERFSVLAYWKEIGLTLAESLPVFSLAILLLMVSSLLWSARKTTKETKNIILLPA